MKVRTGFVSNSSASSFAIFGILTSKEEILEKLLGNPELYTKANVCLHVFDREKCNFCPACGQASYRLVETTSWVDLVEERGLDIETGGYMGGDLLLGVKLKDKTELQGLANAAESLYKTFGQKPTFHSGIKGE